MLCADLPIELIQRSFLNSGLTLAQPATFSSFLTNFELQFFLDEFLTDSIKVYRTLQAMNNNMNPNDLVMSNSGSQNSSVAPVTSRQDTSGALSTSKSTSFLSHAESVDSTTFKDRLRQLGRSDMKIIDQIFEGRNDMKE